MLREVDRIEVTASAWLPAETGNSKKMSYKKGYEKFASPMTCRLDSTVMCIFEPQMFVHWLLPNRVANATPLLAVWHSLLVSLQVCYWLRVVQSAALHKEVLRADVGELKRVWSSAGTEGRRKREISEKTRRPAASLGTIPTCENPGMTRPGIEPGSPRWEVSSLTAQPPWSVPPPPLPARVGIRVHAGVVCLYPAKIRLGQSPDRQPRHVTLGRGERSHMARCAPACPTQGLNSRAEDKPGAGQTNLFPEPSPITLRLSPSPTGRRRSGALQQGVNMLMRRSASLEAGSESSRGYSAGCVASKGQRLPQDELRLEQHNTFAPPSCLLALVTYADVQLLEICEIPRLSGTLFVSLTRARSWQERNVLGGKMFSAGGNNSEAERGKRLAKQCQEVKFRDRGLWEKGLCHVAQGRGEDVLRIISGSSSFLDLVSRILLRPTEGYLFFFSRGPPVSPAAYLQKNRHDGNTARLARRSDDALGVRVSVARMLPRFLTLGAGVRLTLKPIQTQKAFRRTFLYPVRVGIRLNVVSRSCRSTTRLLNKSVLPRAHGGRPSPQETAPPVAVRRIKNLPPRGSRRAFYHALPLRRDGLSPALLYLDSSGRAKTRPGDTTRGHSWTGAAARETPTTLPFRRYFDARPRTCADLPRRIHGKYGGRLAEKLPIIHPTFARSAKKNPLQPFQRRSSGQVKQEGREVEQKHGLWRDEGGGGTGMKERVSHRRYSTVERLCEFRTKRIDWSVEGEKGEGGGGALWVPTPLDLPRTFTQEDNLSTYCTHALRDHAVGVNFISARTQRRTPACPCRSLLYVGLDEKVTTVDGYRSCRPCLLLVSCVVSGSGHASGLRGSGTPPTQHEDTWQPPATYGGSPVELFQPMSSRAELFESGDKLKLDSKPSDASWKIPYMDGKITLRRVHIFSIVSTAKWEDGRKKQSYNDIIYSRKLSCCRRSVWIAHRPIVIEDHGSRPLTSKCRGFLDDFAEDGRENESASHPNPADGESPLNTLADSRKPFTRELVCASGVAPGSPSPRFTLFDCSDETDVEHMYTEVSFATGSHLIRHALDDCANSRLARKQVANPILPGVQEH
ncbi:hypothetical protein PR048_022045 [Dryococelus australis]|uniref:Uncharacterized protein n=1 Tax=Dryococelus australis TaxID=614101 RepID=A0ABQ9GZX3_9NEOP|nr:hypothetical protein PR048_022045 [Dryococelus australis]